MLNRKMKLSSLLSKYDVEKLALDNLVPNGDELQRSKMNCLLTNILINPLTGVKMFEDEIQEMIKEIRILEDHEMLYGTRSKNGEVTLYQTITFSEKLRTLKEEVKR